MSSPSTANHPTSNVTLVGGPGNDRVTAAGGGTTVQEGVAPGRPESLGSGTYRVGQEFAGQGPGSANVYRSTSPGTTEFWLNGGGGRVIGGLGQDAVRVLGGTSKHSISFGAGKAFLLVHGKAVHRPVTATPGTVLAYSRDLGTSKSAVKVNAATGSVRVAGRNLGTVRGVRSWDLLTQGALTFTGTARADNLWVIAKRINARLRAGNDTITARVRTRTGTRVDGGKGRDTVQLRHQRGAQLVKFKAKLISIEIRR